MTSIWDDIQSGRGCVFNPEGETRESQIIDNPDVSKFYNEADMLEDTVLFPEEASGKSAVSLHKSTKTELNSFVDNNPNFVRFYNDLDSSEGSDGEKELSHVIEDASLSDDRLLDNAITSDDKREEADTTEEHDDGESSEEQHSDSHNNEVAKQTTISTKPILRDLVLLSKWKSPGHYSEDIERDF